MEMTVDLMSGTMVPQLPGNIILKQPLSSTQGKIFPNFTFPTFRLVEVSKGSILTDTIPLCPDKDWLLSSPGLHISYAMAKIVPGASKVQITVPFF